MIETCHQEKLLEANALLSTLTFHSIRKDINIQINYPKTYYKRKVYLQWDNWLLSSTPSYVDQQLNHLHEKRRRF